MTPDSKVEIVDITRKSEYETYLYRCLAPIPSRKYKKRHSYLEAAIPKGFHKKLLIFDGKVVGQIEYAPADVSGYPIIGGNVIVMNCIWVLRKAKGHNFGKRLMNNMMKSEKNASGFATIALENHWSPWLKKEQMEKLGFKSIDSIKVTHKTKHRGQRFKIHLMWLPTAIENTNPPTWSKSKLLEGIDFCLAHPLYHPEKPKLKEILEKC
jgi:ribosomal protein S18 acetylase RimI-like enzyme